jgi:hypothetical protein
MMMIMMMTTMMMMTMMIAAADDATKTKHVHLPIGHLVLQFGEEYNGVGGRTYSVREVANAGY